MTAQFPSGPWSVCKCFDHTGEHFKSFDIVPRDGHSLSGVAVLASVFGSEAEARLIAAAPDLYEALEWCVSHDGECLGDNVTKLLNARAALAKARGGA